MLLVFLIFKNCEDSKIFPKTLGLLPLAPHTLDDNIY